ncbi:MurR/RpiR family transcriptional regulator [Herbiconiux sp. CPCC 203407]|uniref:MurR/RpiR family transcriptional regulator n=1 Tax=Herbiconiux oxytropis TaxID=2970915 RepID=A0AA41XH70_9MICO|nr:MurR/RpiR family transcriptional regulator [Herbiconiux oxytropis]MCS5723662.1 MurR/RpiR family transcriptional regulator [Herbiconiux oxytropis]MCS5728071.1 MurR/RpiR family transcriptional regulator [Herbiconiux oxytropis]
MSDQGMTDNLLHQISRRAGSLSPALRGVAEVILTDPEVAQSLSITELAGRAGVADSTVSRFLRELELDGYNQLRLGIAQAIYSRPGAAEPKASWVYEGVLKGDTPSAVVEKVLHGSLEALTRTAERLDPEIVTETVERIHAASSVYFAAMGSSSTAAENATMRFVRAGVRCHFFRDQSVQSMGSATLGANDVLIAISDSGDSTSVVSSAQIAKFHGAHTVGITSNVDSALASVVDRVLVTAGTVASSDVYGESVTAKWGQLLAIDVLYATYATKYYEETADYLQESYLSAIKPTRVSGSRG